MNQKTIPIHAVGVDLAAHFTRREPMRFNLQGMDVISQQNLDFRITLNLYSMKQIVYNHNNKLKNYVQLNHISS